MVYGLDSAVAATTSTTITATAITTTSVTTTGIAVRCRITAVSERVVTVAAAPMIIRDHIASIGIRRVAPGVVDPVPATLSRPPQHNRKNDDSEQNFHWPPGFCTLRG